MKKSRFRLLTFTLLLVFASSSQLILFPHLFFHFLIFTAIFILPIQITLFFLDRKYEAQVKQHQLLLEELEQLKQQAFSKYQKL